MPMPGQARAILHSLAWLGKAAENNAGQGVYAQECPTDIALFGGESMKSLGELLSRAVEHATRYRSDLGSKPAGPLADYHSLREKFNAPLPLTGADPVEVLDQLAAMAEPGLMPTVGPRFFAWVMGGSDPVGVAADFLVSAWGQNAGYHSTAPSAAAIEEVAERWLLEILDLPHTSGIGFATGATVANGREARQLGAIERRSHVGVGAPATRQRYRLAPACPLLRPRQLLLHGLAGRHGIIRRSGRRSVPPQRMALLPNLDFVGVPAGDWADDRAAQDEVEPTAGHGL